MVKIRKYFHLYSARDYGSRKKYFYLSYFLLFTFWNENLRDFSVSSVISVLRVFPDHCGTAIELRKLGMAIDKSKSRLYYDRSLGGQSFFMPDTLRGQTTNFCPSSIMFRQLRLCWHGAPLLPRGEVCSFQLFLDNATCPSRIWVPRNSWTYFLLKLPQAAGPCSCMYSVSTKSTRGFEELCIM
jgi:hypothetical protein